MKRESAMAHSYPAKCKGGFLAQPQEAKEAHHKALRKLPCLGNCVKFSRVLVKDLAKLGATGLISTMISM